MVTAAYEPPARYNLDQSVCVRELGPTDYTDLVVVSCGGPHGGQVIHQVELRGGWPGTAGAPRAAETECRRQLDSTTASVEPRAKLSWIYPIEARQWVQDHGAVICLVSTPSWENGL